MADVVVTAAEVLKDSGTVVAQGTAGAAITAGQVVYSDGTDGDKYKLADADDTAATAALKGIALNDAADEQPLQIAIAGTLDPGFTVGIGSYYVLSGTAGGIAPVADLASADYASLVGVGITAAQLKLLIDASGVQVP